MLRQRPPHTSSSTVSSPSSSSPPSPPLKTSSSASTTGMSNARQPLLQGRKKNQPPLHSSLSSPPDSPSSPLDDITPEAPLPAVAMDLSTMSRQSQWITLAVASGACAAFNGVFAKLTTTELTTSFATGIAKLLGLAPGEKVIEVVIRGIFFALNLIFNGVMWTLFTKALARGTSTTQVSIINTSANFIITALLGFFIFTESLPPLWWLGAALLVAGNVIIGRREEKDIDPVAEIHAAENGEAADSDVLLRSSIELNDESEATLKRQREDEDDILDLGDQSDH